MSVRATSLFVLRVRGVRRLEGKGKQSTERRGPCLALTWLLRGYSNVSDQEMDDGRATPLITSKCERDETGRKGPTIEAPMALRPVRLAPRARPIAKSSAKSFKIVTFVSYSVSAPECSNVYWEIQSNTCARRGTSTPKLAPKSTQSKKRMSKG